jgi:hypothetical protein
MTTVSARYDEFDRVGATHRKLSTFLNALLDAQLEAECFVEPPAPVPTFPLWRCRRRWGFVHCSARRCPLLALPVVEGVTGSPTARPP